MIISIAPPTSKEKLKSYQDWFDHHKVDTKILSEQYPEIEGMLILCGGADVGTKPKRDKFEKMLIEQAVSKNIPIFGICRGMQMVNWCLGGVVEDLLDEEYHCNNLKVSGETGVHNLPSKFHMVYDLEGNRFMVNSRHHQTCSILSNDLKPLHYSEDGTIESAFSENILLVQWHPERKELWKNKKASIELIEWIKKNRKQL